MRMFYELSRFKLDLWYERMCKLNPTYQEWLKRELKEKYVLCYDGGHRYDNMTTNFSESFNHVLKRSSCNTCFNSSVIDILQVK